MDRIYDSLYLSLAVEEARRFDGCTAPNPPVGAVLVRDGKILARGAHERAGQAHAETAAISRFLLAHPKETLKGAVLYVTLEPCNHHGKTPPCTKAIIDAGIARVVIGTRDPNPEVKGGGLDFLQTHGIETRLVEHLESRKLIAPFVKWAMTQTPWLTHKIAVRLAADGTFSMAPEKGEKTFTRKESLILAHEERKRADAILTTMKTVLADAPLFTVRECPDHEGKKRTIAVFTRTPRATLPEAAQKALNEWIAQEEALGMEVLFFSEIAAAMAELGKRGALRVLLEAGPSFSKEVIENKLADETLWIYHDPHRDADKIVHTFKGAL